MMTNGEHEGLIRRVVEDVEEAYEDDDDTFTKRPGAKDDTTGTR